MQDLCPTCHILVAPTYYFCPNCGTKLKEKPPNTTVLYQIGLYALAIFLPPLGLWPAVKYLRSTDPVAKKIGIVLIILTVVSTIVTTWYAVQLVNQISSGVSKELNQYNGSGMGF